MQGQVAIGCKGTGEVGGPKPTGSAQGSPAQGSTQRAASSGSCSPALSQAFYTLWLADALPACKATALLTRVVTDDGGYLAQRARKCGHRQRLLAGGACREVIHHACHLRGKREESRVVGKRAQRPASQMWRHAVLAKTVVFNTGQPCKLPPPASQPSRRPAGRASRAQSGSARTARRAASAPPHPTRGGLEGHGGEPWACLRGARNAEQVTPGAGATLHERQA